MFELAWPWALVAVPLPFVARRLLTPDPSTSGVSLRVPFFRAATAWSSAVPSLKGAPFAWFLAFIVWCALVLAGARPQWVGDPLHVPLTGRDLLLAIDLSGSMAEQDHILDGHRVDRLATVKQIAGDFFERRMGDRVGLILFGSKPYIQVPLTFDLTMTRRLLQEASIGLAGGQTAIGDAIGLAIQVLRQRPAKSRVLVLLTDGANTTGRLSPVDAARLAAFHGLRIHTIGLGTTDRLEPSGTAITGDIQSADLDEHTLREISRITGGSYFRAEDPESLVAVYRLIDEIEPAADHRDIVRPPQELFYWPLSLAYAIGILVALGILFQGMLPIIVGFAGPWLSRSRSWTAFTS